MHDRITRIARLNDQCRQAPGIYGDLILTTGIRALPAADQSHICEVVQSFDTFTDDNDPYGEHDFGAFVYSGHRVFWKIDYYDPTLVRGTRDAADPTVTRRVLTIMLAEEY